MLYSLYVYQYKVNDNLLKGLCIACQAIAKIIKKPQIDSE